MCVCYRPGQLTSHDYISGLASALLQESFLPAFDFLLAVGLREACGQLTTMVVVNTTHPPRHLLPFF